MKAFTPIAWGFIALTIMCAAAGLTACAGSAQPELVGHVTGGHPLAGVRVAVIDSRGRRLESAPTDAQGGFRLKIGGMTAPLVLSAPAMDGDEPSRFANVITAEEMAAGKAMPDATLNPLTTLLVQRLLGTTMDQLSDPAALSASIVATRLDSARIDAVRDDLERMLQPIAAAAAEEPASFAKLGARVLPDSEAARQLGQFLERAHIELRFGRIRVGGLQGVTLAFPPQGPLPDTRGLDESQRAAIRMALQRPTATPIEHLIVIVGENHSFDSVFATYTPPPGESVRNLLSAGIVRADGTPGDNYARAAQNRAQSSQVYSLDPTRTEAYKQLPRPTLIGVYDSHFRVLGTGVDVRFPADLPPGPFQISRYVRRRTPSRRMGLSDAAGNLGAATGDPPHRFFQMWQQTGGDNARLDLYTWVSVTAGMGGDTKGVQAGDTGQGGEVMGFVNIDAGDAPVFRDFATRYAMSDNYHQSIMGGTGANFFALSTGDLPYYNREDRAQAPPQNQIENPDPRAGTNNFYQRDGYQGGSFVNCSDPGQPGVAPILAFLERARVASRCERHHYYLVNNYSAGYDLDGHSQPIGPDNYNYPPQSVRTIAEALSERGVEWNWYTGGRDPADVGEEIRTLKISLASARRMQYNDIGDPLTASTAVMSTPTLRARLKGLSSFSADVRSGSLPAVSFVVPKNLDSGHPGYSVLTSYESFLAGIVAQVRAQPALWAHTAIIATTDEGGGHFDSGYIQTVDFFGDGPRIPLLVISPYARVGHVDHQYNDHASILKFIERNWNLNPLSARSRDNLADPVVLPEDPYRPVNGPAVGDLMTLFDFQGT